MSVRPHALLLACLVACAGCKKDDRVAGAVSEARALTDQYRAALQEELTSALQAGGPARAIEVCQVEAPKIGSRVARKEGWTIQRTAFRVRNPANAPNEWQRRGLEVLRERLAAGGEPAGVEWHEVADGRLRYMRAIPLGGMCAVCHGQPESIPQEAKAKLRELYPEDQAVGFSVGELRGAFVVTAPL